MNINIYVDAVSEQMLENVIWIKGTTWLTLLRDKSPEILKPNLPLERKEVQTRGKIRDQTERDNAIEKIWMLLVVVNLNCVCSHHWWYISSSLAAIGIWFIWWRYPPSWCGNMFTSCLNAGLAPGGMEVNFYWLDLETKHNDLIWKISSPKQNNWERDIAPMRSTWQPAGPVCCLGPSWGNRMCNSDVCW